MENSSHSRNFETQKDSILQATSTDIASDVNMHVSKESQETYDGGRSLHVRKDLKTISMDTYTRSRHLYLDSEFQMKGSRFTSKKQIKFLRNRVDSQLKF